MSDLENRFLQLVAQREQAIQLLKDSQEEFEQLMTDLGVDTMFQANDGIVYKIEVPKGRFVDFPKIGYKRSRGKDGDPKSGGSFLSKSEAKDAGFDI